jgi:hypothetical protein
MIALKSYLTNTSNMKLKEIITILEGYKTYLIMAALVVFAFSGVSMGILDQTEAFKIILEALGLGALRSAIKK